MIINIKIRVIGFLILAASTLAPSHGADCDTKSYPDQTWGVVLTTSDQLSNLICRRLEGTADESRTVIDNLLKNWREKVMASAKLIDKELGLTATGLPDEGDSGRVAASMSQLAAVFVADVEQTLAPVFQTENSVMRQTIVAGGIGVPSISSRDKDQRLIVNTITETKINQVGIRVPITGRMDDRCRAAFDSICIVAVDNWAVAVSAYKGSLVRLTAEKLSELAVVYSKDWEDFYNNARAQTFLDTIYTANRYKDELTSTGFVKAPDKQYFLFRPSVVMEYVDGASDGEQFRGALSFEWYGFNYWRGCPVLFDSACGLSLVSTVSDRSSADDHSFGIMVHYDNNLSLGVVQGTGDDNDVGYFVTIDLLKAIESKQELVGKWKQEVKDKYKALSEQTTN